MPSLIDKERVPAGKDRRVKIPTSERAYICERVKRGEAIRALAREYGVDKRTIQFIVYPERLALVREQKKKRGGWRKYYDKDKWKLVQREHRAYKRSVIIKKADEPQP